MAEALEGDADETIRGSVSDRLYDRWLHDIASCRECASDLSQQFNDGGVLQPGDRVVITTTAGVRHQVRVRSVHDGVIYGDHDSVPFSEVATVERRESSGAKTTILVVVILGVVALIAAAVQAGSHPNTSL